MRIWSKVDGQRYRGMSLRAHTLLTDVPLHDAWQVRLPGGGPGRTLTDARALLSGSPVAVGNPLVRALFQLRRWLGQIFDWDKPPKNPDAASYLNRLTPEDRSRSLVQPGSADGPFTVLYAFENEAVSEARNSTVHAFLVYVLEPDETADDDGYLLTWAIHVQPVSAITPLYMALIYPFRRFIVYPAILKQMHRRWIATYPAG